MALTHAIGHGSPAQNGWGNIPEFRLTDDEFATFSRLIYDTAGIKLAPVKKVMLASRLRKRLLKLGYSSYREYLDFLLSDEGQRHEMVFMLDVVSTNKTEFFREPQHFTLLTSLVLPGFLQRHGGRRSQLLRAWSAGCSSGEEPYTLAMVLAEFCRRCPKLDFTILATDLSTAALASAERAIYEEEKIEPVPLLYRQQYLMRGFGQQKGLYRVVPELRQKVTVRRLNLMDTDFSIKRPLDIIFCRNVLIYFDRPTKITLLKNFYQNLAPGGYLFIGHSESLEGISEQMERIGPTLYRKSSESAKTPCHDDAEA